MRLKVKLLAGLMLVVATAALAQNRFKRGIAGVTREGWYAIPLPPDIFHSLNRDLSDLRIYQFKGADTLEVPYLLRVLEDVVEDSTVKLRVFNKSKRDGKLYVSFELKKNQQVNRLDLDFKEDNFNGNVQLEGSPDKKDWYAIDTPQRILSIQNELVTFKATTLDFSLTNYPYLRIRIESDESLTFKQATFKKRETKFGVRTNIPSVWSTAKNKQRKTTLLEVTLPQFQPVNGVKIKTDDKMDFYRPITIEAVRDSVKTSKGWNYNYDQIYSGYIISSIDHGFDFPYTLVKKLRITVDNADNPSLNFQSILVSGPQIELVSRLTMGEHFLFYGNTSASSPSYDVVHFKDKIPADLPPASLGLEEGITRPSPTTSPLFENKLWLWSILGVVIALLGFFTLKMMRSR